MLTTYWEGTQDALIASVLHVHQFTVWRWRVGRSFPARKYWPALAMFLCRPVGDFQAAHAAYKNGGGKNNDTPQD